MKSKQRKRTEQFETDWKISISSRVDSTQFNSARMDCLHAPVDDDLTKGKSMQSYVMRCTKRTNERMENQWTPQGRNNMT
mmetsp:Transcript_4539/g.9908  ORF Transcript_4539/g.9908 Transcript_4539/m.9908 type:complete len:80 (+) Transcript_4539:586-825(+)